MIARRETAIVGTLPAFAVLACSLTLLGLYNTQPMRAVAWRVVAFMGAPRSKLRRRAW